MIIPSNAFLKKDSLPIASFNYLNIQNFSYSMKNLKNSLEYPSGPGALFNLLF